MTQSMTELLSGTTGMDLTRGEELGPCSPQDRSAHEDPGQQQDQGAAHRPSLEAPEQRKERRRRLEIVLRALI
jgi:hypothetical protein